MITVNGWCAGGNGGGGVGERGVSVQSIGEIRKGFCPNFLQPFLENIDRKSCNNGGRELIPVFYNSHWKSRPSPSAVVLIVEFLVRHLTWRYLIIRFHSYSTPAGTFDWWFVVTIKRLSSIMCANRPWICIIIFINFILSWLKNHIIDYTDVQHRSTGHQNQVAYVLI